MAAAMADTEVDMAAMAVMDTMARDLPMLSPKLLPLPSQDMAAIVDMEAMDTEATAVDMAADTEDTAAMVAMEAIMARDLLTLRLVMAVMVDSPAVMAVMVVMVDSPAVMAVMVDSPAVMAVTDTARDLLMLTPLSDMAVIAAMDMAVMEADTAVDMDTAAVMEVMAAMAIMVKLSHINLNKSSVFFLSLLIQELLSQILAVISIVKFNLSTKIKNNIPKDILLKF